MIQKTPPDPCKTREEIRKMKKREYNKWYRATHKEQRHIYDKRYYDTHKDNPDFMEKRREVCRRCLKKHRRHTPEEVKAFSEKLSKRYKALTPEEKREYNHQRYLRRREKALEYARTHPSPKKTNNPNKQDK